MLTLIVSWAFAQECSSPCTYEELCLPAPLDACAYQADASDDFQGVQWVDRQGGWHATQHWASSPTYSDDHPSLYLFEPGLTGGAASGTNEAGCGVEASTGAIRCWGNMNGSGQISGRPTGGEPYSELTLGNNDTVFGALTGSGAVAVWGNVTANGFNSGKPSGTGYDTIAVGYGPVGCVADTAGSGVTCWGNNAQSIVSGAPSTGSYTDLAIGRYSAFAVKSDGTLASWGSATSSTLRSNCSGLTNVSEVYLQETGTQFIVAYHSDGTLTVCQDSAQSQIRAIRNGPCVNGTNCPGTADKSWTFEPEFRTSPRPSRQDQPGDVCGVIRSDPNSQYECGDVICWGHYAETTGDPMLVNECDDPDALCQ